MPGRPSSNPKPPQRFTSVHLIASSFAAVAGVALAAYQTLSPSSAPPPLPVQVNVALAPEPGAAVAKTDTESEIKTAVRDLGQGARVSAALLDGAEQRYELKRLFDRDGASFVTLQDPDRELNVLVSFAQAGTMPVTAIEYVPPDGIDGEKLATALDVMVLPEDKMDAGRPVFSFSLQTSPGTQTFEIPGHMTGKAMWLRVAGKDGVSPAIGDFRILSEPAAP
ncbi:MAG: hypothetical protein ACKVP5_02390 [Aestuariivirga sp.]